MTTVKLRKTLRYLNDFDTDFDINSEEEKLIPDKNLRSYSIKQKLFSNMSIMRNSSRNLKLSSSTQCPISINSRSGLMVRIGR